MAPSFNTSLVLSTLCMNMCIIHMYLSACAVKNQSDQENEKEGLETERLEGGGENREGVC
jgi:hypothetical protein